MKITKIDQFNVTFDQTTVNVSTERVTFEQYKLLSDALESGEFLESTIELSEVLLIIPSELENVGFDSADCLELFEAVDDDSDVTLELPNGEEWRMIADSEIAEIHHDELTDDPYTLGCFSSSFIASHLGISSVAVEKFQQAEAFAGIGELILASDTREFCEDYANVDGYAHHFAHYDHEGYEVELNGQTFHAFRTN